MILTVGNVKGGVGKTTLAINLAIALTRSGRDALLIDGDEQGTAAAFTERQKREAAPAIPLLLYRERLSAPRFVSSPPSMTTS